MKVSIHNADCLRILKGMPDCSVDSIVTDPPYGLSFMGKKWDYDVPTVEVWAECLRVLKPGGHLLAFAGTRTQHRMAVRIEDAGFEIRDMIAWVYGSGFPKSLDVSKAIDKAAGAEREQRWKPVTAGRSVGTLEPRPWLDEARKNGGCFVDGETPATEAQRWQGWGTALKPALEPITVARKPLSGTVAETVLQHGTGAINIDGCRVGTETITQRLATVEGGKAIGAKAVGLKQKATGETTTTIGRWPANFIHDGSDEVTGLFPETAPSKASAGVTRKNGVLKHGGQNARPSHNTTDRITEAEGYNDAGGSAARFFYCAKSSKKDRGEGNNHPTVKPTDLMRYLCRLVTPPNGTVLDPYMGSGSTGKAAVLEGFSFIGIEMNAEYYAIARTRIKSAKGVK